MNYAQLLHGILLHYSILFGWREVEGITQKGARGGGTIGFDCIMYCEMHRRTQSRTRTSSSLLCLVRTPGAKRNTDLLFFIKFEHPSDSIP